MNNTVLKNIAFAASGALFGALGGILVAKKVYSGKFEAELAEYKESQASHYEMLTAEVKDLLNKIDVYESAGLSFETAKMIAAKNKQALEVKEKKMREQEENALKINRNYANEYNKAKERVKQVDPEKHMDILETIPGDEFKKFGEFLEGVEDFTPSEMPKNEEPYLISVDQFADEHDEFRKASCTYYTEDKVICETSHNEKIDPRHVGQENLDMLDGSDIDILYVRNEYLQIDYEIDKYEGSYSYEVLGEESLNE